MALTAKSFVKGAILGTTAVIFSPVLRGLPILASIPEKPLPLGTLVAAGITVWIASLILDSIRFFQE